jgi:putative glycosyltransferase (TIGR04372 family)
VLAAPLTNPARTPHTSRADSKPPKLSQVNFKSKLPQQFRRIISLVMVSVPLNLIAIFLSLIFLFLRPFLLVYFEPITPIFGHLVLNTNLSRLKTISFNKTNRRKMLVIYYFLGEPSNKAMKSIWSRNLFVVSYRLGRLLEKYNTKSEKVNTQSWESQYVDFGGLLHDKEFPFPSFSRSEHIDGRRFLGKNCPDSKFICLYVRDNAYTSKSELYQKKSVTHGSAHQFRNAKIDTYVKSAETLANLEYTVFRMGAIVEEPLVSKHLQVIDYATNGMRTEFLDIYLGAHCTFAISTAAGWDSIPTIFRRPIIFTNTQPTFAPSILCLPCLIYPKQFFDLKSQKLLSLNSLIDQNLAKADDQIRLRQNEKIMYNLNEIGLELRDLSSEELVEAVAEMAQRVEGTFVETPEQKEMQAKLKHILSTHPKLQPSPNYYPIRAQFASCFLSRYPNFLDGLD